MMCKSRLKLRTKMIESRNKARRVSAISTLGKVNSVIEDRSRNNSRRNRADAIRNPRNKISEGHLLSNRREEDHHLRAVISVDHLHKDKIREDHLRRDVSKMNKAVKR